MKVYNYHPRTRAFRFEEDADLDPLNPGNWLIPAHATTIKPPETNEHEIACFNDEDREWTVLKLDQPNIPYYVLRARAYPPITDYIDGIVKNDHNQINKYIEKCKKVKERYPKPSDDISYDI